jgi:hypothetical protein
VGDSDEWERFKGGGESFPEKNNHWGLVGYIPTIVGLMGYFLGAEKKRGWDWGTDGTHFLSFHL